MLLKRTNRGITCNMRPANAAAIRGVDLDRPAQERQLPGSSRGIRATETHPEATMVPDDLVVLR